LTDLWFCIVTNISVKHTIEKENGVGTVDLAEADLNASSGLTEE